MKDGIAYFDCLPKEIRQLIFKNDVLSVRDTGNISLTSKNHRADIRDIWFAKIKTESQYLCGQNDIPGKIYYRILDLKNLFMEAEYFRRNYFPHFLLDAAPELNKNKAYEEKKAIKVIATIPEENRIQTILFKKNYLQLNELAPMPGSASLLNILRRAGKYKKNDEWIILQTPWLIQFLIFLDFLTIINSDKNFDYLAFHAFIKNPDLVLKVNPDLISEFLDASSCEQILFLIVSHPQIEAHLRNNERIRQSIDACKADLLMRYEQSQLSFEKFYTSLPMKESNSVYADDPFDLETENVQYLPASDNSFRPF